MKNIIFAAIVCCGTFASINAEEIYSPEHVINNAAEVAEAPEAIEMQDTTVVVNYILNPTGPEYECGSSHQSTTTNILWRRKAYANGR